MVGLTEVAPLAKVTKENSALFITGHLDEDPKASLEKVGNTDPTLNKSYIKDAYHVTLNLPVPGGNNVSTTPLDNEYDTFDNSKNEKTHTMGTLKSIGIKIDEYSSNRNSILEDHDKYGTKAVPHRKSDCPS